MKSNENLTPEDVGYYEDAHYKCPLCHSVTITEIRRGWWCSNPECKFRKKADDMRKSDKYRPDHAESASECVVSAAETPRTTALMLQHGKAVANGKTRPAIWPVMMVMEAALIASIDYDEARREHLDYEVAGIVPERLKGQPDTWVASVLDVAAAEAGEKFRNLRKAALRIL